MADEHQNRQFDWGPPVQSNDNMKEWLVYVAIIAILGLGTWFLLDLNNQKHTRKSSKVSDIVAIDNKLDTVVSEKSYEEAPEIPETTEITIKYGPEGIDKAEPTKVSTSNKSFYVQIGAFGDEPSANEIFDLLKKEGIEATLLKPDAQFEIYRLVVGPFATEELAESKAEKLNSIDFPCFVVEAQ